MVSCFQFFRMKSQVENNEKLHRKIVSAMLEHEMFNTKDKCANVLKGVLINNLSDEEIKYVIFVPKIRLFINHLFTGDWKILRN